MKQNRDWAIQNVQFHNVTIDQTNQTNNTQRLELFYQPVPQEAFITIIVISTTIAAIASGLLVHLFAFHVYIKTIGKNVVNTHDLSLITGIWDYITKSIMSYILYFSIRYNNI